MNLQDARCNNKDNCSLNWMVGNLVNISAVWAKTRLFTVRRQLKISDLHLVYSVRLWCSQPYAVFIECCVTSQLLFARYFSTREVTRTCRFCTPFSFVHSSWIDRLLGLFSTGMWWKLLPRIGLYNEEWFRSSGMMWWSCHAEVHNNDSFRLFHLRNVVLNNPVYCIFFKIIVRSFLLYI